MIDPEDALGITDEPTTIPIERGKIREFALACFDANPEYTQAPVPPIPPTYLTVRSFWMTASTSPLARVGLDLRRLLHGGEEYVFQFDVRTWGWVHVFVGLVILAAALALFTGATWARVIGVVVAAVAMLVGFAWLPWYPLWAILFIVTSASVIWALTAHGRDIAT